jgi:hypothetical protein
MDILPGLAASGVDSRCRSPGPAVSVKNLSHPPDTVRFMTYYQGGIATTIRRLIGSIGLLTLLRGMRWSQEALIPRVPVLSSRAVVRSVPAHGPGGWRALRHCSGRGPAASWGATDGVRLQYVGRVPH